MFYLLKCDIKGNEISMDVVFLLEMCHFI